MARYSSYPGDSPYFRTPQESLDAMSGTNAAIKALIGIDPSMDPHGYEAYLTSRMMERNARNAGTPPSAFAGPLSDPNWQKYFEALDVVSEATGKPVKLNFPDTPTDNIASGMTEQERRDAFNAGQPVSHQPGDVPQGFRPPGFVQNPQERAYGAFAPDEDPFSAYRPGASRRPSVKSLLGR